MYIIPFDAHAYLACCRPHSYRSRALCIAMLHRGGASSLAEENLETWFSVLCEGLLGLASAQIYMPEGVQENSRKVLKTKA